MNPPDLRLSLVQGVMPWWATALRCPSRVSHPWRCAHQQPPMAYFPPTKPLQRRRPLFTSYLWFCWTEETNSRTSILYASYYSSCFWWIINQQAPFWLRAIETKSGQIWCSIPACRQVVSAPALFWERGARCFVGRLSLGRWVRLQRFLVNG